MNKQTPKKDDSVKFESLFAFVKTTKGTFHQIVLSRGEQAAVADVIYQLHDGEIKAFEKSMPFEVEEK